MQADIPKLYTAIAEWLFAMVFPAVFSGQVKKRGMAARALSFLAALVVLQLFCGMVTNVLWLVGMLAAFLCMYGLIKTSLPFERSACLSMTCRAFLAAECTAALEWQVYTYYFLRTGRGNIWNAILFCIPVYAAALFLVYSLEKRILPERFEGSLLSVTGRDCLFSLLITAFFFAMSNLSYVYAGTPFTGTDTGTIYNIRTLMDLAGVLVLYIMHLQRLDSAARQKNEAIQNILQRQYQQYRMSQENIDLINRKYHDLKNQLQVIRLEKDADRRSACLDEIESGIDAYEAQYQTGNSVLDTILTQKGRKCLQLGITLTVVADGTLVSGLHVTDICTIFGNALDNAIEYEAQVQDPEKRLIHVSVSEKLGMMDAVVENRFEGKLTLKDDGLPQTTKPDKKNHGYGMKSIRYAAEKYGGSLQVHAGDGWFRTRILIPLPDKS